MRPGVPPGWCRRGMEEPKVEHPKGAMITGDPRSLAHG